MTEALVTWAITDLDEARKGQPVFRDRPPAEPAVSAPKRSMTLMNTICTGLDIDDPKEVFQGGGHGPIGMNLNGKCYVFYPYRKTFSVDCDEMVSIVTERRSVEFMLKRERKKP